MSFANLWSAEIIKFRTLRSYLITVIAAIAVAGIAAALVGTGVDAKGNIPGMGTSIQAVAFPMEVVIYAMMVLGVLIATGDLRSGTFRITSIMSPWRRQVLTAKFTAAAVIALAVGVVSTVLAYVGGLLTGGSGYSPLSGDGGLLVLTTMIAVPLATILGTAVGLLLRNTAGAVALLLVWALGIEAVFAYTVPPEVVAFLPFKTVGAAVANLPLGPLAGLGMFTLYVAIATGLAIFVYERRDLGT
ncbi:hypothetical protein [Nonomuraea sp. NPDC049784]|uniref:hypothetical protein n=1 Tax=Nonomuraea sp. NPDC049784 TaxID=3154361 RepID=UPI0034066387